MGLDYTNEWNDPGGGLIVGNVTNDYGYPSDAVTGDQSYGGNMPGLEDKNVYYPDPNGTTMSTRTWGGGWSPSSGGSIQTGNSGGGSSYGSPSSGLGRIAAPSSNSDYMPSGSRVGNSVTFPKTVKPAASPAVSQYMSAFNPNITPPSYVVPTFEAMPTLAAPKYNEKEAERIGYKESAPYVYQIKSAINRAVSQALGMPAGPAQALSFQKIVAGAAPMFDNAQKTGANYGRQVYGDIFKTDTENAYRQYTADVNATTFRNTALQNKSNMDFTAQQKQYDMAYQAALQDWMRAQG